MVEMPSDGPRLGTNSWVGIAKKKSHRGCATASCGSCFSSRGPVCSQILCFVTKEDLKSVLCYQVTDVFVEEYSQLEPLINEPLKATCIRCPNSQIWQLPPRPARLISWWTSDGAAPRLQDLIPCQSAFPSRLKVHGMAPMGRMDLVLDVLRRRWLMQPFVCGAWCVYVHLVLGPGAPSVQSPQMRPADPLLELDEPGPLSLDQQTDFWFWW